MVKRRVLAVVAVIGCLVTGCSKSRATSTPAAPTGTQTTVWLCRPGAAPDPCAIDQAATSVNAAGVSTPQPAPPATGRAFDCFYVYGTVSAEAGTNADLQIHNEETEVAEEQASRFSSVCRVWAPVYRQITVAGLFAGNGSSPAAIAVATRSVLSAWDDYLAHDNQGRPVVFIGHSQGAAMIIRLLQQKVDDVPALRRRTVSALILGGNVAVPDGKDVGSTFDHLPTCASPTSTGCVIAYSTFASPPPSDSLFGIPGQGVSALSGLTATTGVHVACVNPGLIGATRAVPITPYFAGPAPAGPAPAGPAPAGTAPAGWTTYPDLYTAACATGGGASWLQIDTTRLAGDIRRVVAPTLGPTWGLHIYDVNLPLGNLVSDVAGQEAAYTASLAQ